MVVKIMRITSGHCGKQAYLSSRLPIPCVCLLALGFLLGCNQTREAGELTEALTLAAYAGDTTSLIWIAEDQGFFADNGLDVEIEAYEAGKLAADALLAGEADIATAAEFVFVSQSFDHDDLRVFGAIATAQVNEVVARVDRGIRHPSDLRGKRIGVTRKSAGEFFLGRFLLFNGLFFEDVEVVDLSPSAIVQAMSNGEIDACLTWDPNVYEIKNRLGENSISWPGQSDQDLYFVLIGRLDWVRSNPETVERFVRAIVQAEEYLEENAAEVQQAIQERFEYESAYVQYIWPRQSFEVTLPQALIIAMEDEARWRIENDLTDKPTVPNYLDFLLREPLEAVHPEAVTVIR